MEPQSSNAIANSPALEKNYRLYRSILDKILSPMQAGALRVLLPSGEEIVYGRQRPGPEATIRVLDPAFFRKCILYGDVGFGEAYVDGDWDTDDVVAVISWFIFNVENSPTVSGSNRRFSFTNFLQLLNRFRHKVRDNNLSGSRRNISEHYDLSNDFFALFLDRSMTYSSAYFRSEEDSLEEAQAEKYDRLCRKLQLSSRDHLLEIGSGWGGFASHAARNYGCRITSVTISKEQLQYAQQRIADEGLAEQVEFQLMDYRNIRGQFDKIVSIEMLEAVGHPYFKAYFEKCHQLLRKDGLLGIQVITCPDSRYESYRRSVDWIQKHIFPGGLLPSIATLNRAINETGDMQLHHLEEMGLHYARTLATWRDNFNHRLEAVLAQGFSETFIRKWNYYLTYCEAAFRMRNVTVIQAIYTRPNNLNI